MVYWQLRQDLDLSIPDVPFPVLLSTLIRSRFQAKPATLLIPIDFPFPFAFEELYATRYQSGSFFLINVGSGFHFLRSIFFFSFVQDLEAKQQRCRMVWKAAQAIRRHENRCRKVLNGTSRPGNIVKGLHKIIKCGKVLENYSETRGFYFTRDQYKKCVHVDEEDKGNVWGTCKKAVLVTFGSRLASVSQHLVAGCVNMSVH